MLISQTKNFGWTEETAVQFQKRTGREGHCYHGAFLPKKGLTYKKCFVLPLVDSIEDPNFRLFSVIRRCRKPQKVPMACGIFLM